MAIEVYQWMAAGLVCPAPSDECNSSLDARLTGFAAARERCDLVIGRTDAQFALGLVLPNMMLPAEVEEV